MGSEMCIRDRNRELSSNPMASKKRTGLGAPDAEYLERARRDALRRDYRELTPGQRVEQAAALSKEMTSLAARRAERG